MRYPLAESEPAYRASVLKLLLEHVDGLSRGDLVREHLGRAIPAAIEAAGRSDWLPVGWGGDIYEAIGTTLGERMIQTVAANMVMKAPSRPIFQPLMRGVTQFFGRAPAQLLRTYALAQRFSARNAGSFAVVVGRPTLVHVRGLPPALRRRAWQVAQVGVLEATLRMAGGEGTVEIVGDEFAATGDVDFVVHL